ncbi:MAG: hypothetical protein M1831_007491 [Alyxoria varia]|nr:MAG: hypothetical protein M1831_007491 [Alyxoria varia]
MGKLIKNHLARLMVMVAAVCHFAATIHCFLWPKTLWDRFTLLLDDSVKPVPILQTINLISCLSILMIDFPFPARWVAGTGAHRSFELRLLGLYPAATLLSGLMYQGAEAAGFYVIAWAVWFWAFSEGEVICEKPWALPKKSRSKPKEAGSSGGGGGGIDAAKMAQVNAVTSYEIPQKV